MASDKPLDAIETQIRAEERTDLPLVPAVLLENLPWGIGQAFRKFVAKQKDERGAAYLKTLSDELSYLGGKVESVARAQARFSDDDFRSLVLDAWQKAEEARTLRRIQQIARIIANAATAAKPDPRNVTEELTRIAMDLDDVDVRVLDELVRRQDTAFAPSSGRVNDEAANDFWRTGHAASRIPGSHDRFTTFSERLDISEGELQSRCAKLQSFGLVVQVERRPDRNPPGIIPYAVLARGIEFVKAIKSLGGATETAAT
jgi:hypothetical protein